MPTKLTKPTKTRASDETCGAGGRRVFSTDFSTDVRAALRRHEIPARLLSRRGRDDARVARRGGVLSAAASHRRGVLPAENGDRPRSLTAPPSTAPPHGIHANGGQLLLPGFGAAVASGFKIPRAPANAAQAGYRKDASSSDRHFFYAPTDVSLRAAWNKAVPRADKEFTATSRVRDLHFHQQDILKTYVHVIDGKSVEIPRGKWSLAKDAVPKVFPNLPAYLSKPPEKKRKLRCKSAKRPADQASEQRQGAPCYNLEQPEDFPAQDTQELTIADMKSVELPPGWRVMRGFMNMVTGVRVNSSHFSQ
ncbi:hypothetical protein HPB52_015706 [Rhipicephalus sanguineus]|uniref:THAP-type domain-containing protein n=1 Tax=Rhipicephalus sanguineus TaxID=34632 RepID=A0A9D4PP21_RHISA|nr:hypothetical protein HPB52_015706 [Rhipicephalus sanguineus]